MSKISINTSTAKREYAGVDLFKLIACLLIIAIHTKPFQSNFLLDGGVGLLTRFAVPYFFVASGFFFFARERTLGDLITWSKRIFRIYSIWFVVYYLCLWTNGESHTALYWVGNFVWPTNGSILWFLPALVYSAWIVYFLRHKAKLSAGFIMAISLLFLVIGYSLTTIYPLCPVSLEGLKSIFKYIGFQNALFFGFPYLALANFIATTENRTYSIKKYFLLMMLFFFCLAVEAYIIITWLSPDLTFLWLSAFPMTYCCFILSTSIKLPSSNTWVIMRKCSLLVYVIHPLIIKAIDLFLAVSGIPDYDNVGLYVSTCVITVALSWTLYKASQTKTFSFLNILL